MDIKDLLFIASGYKDKNRIPKILFGRADIIRIGDNIYDKKLIKINLKQILDDNLKFSLKAGDNIKIYTTDLFEDEPKVEIVGMVNNPGEYEIIEGMNLADLILMAGGFAGSTKNYKIEVSNTMYKGNEEFFSSSNSSTIENKKRIFCNHALKKIIFLNYIIKKDDFVSVFNKSQDSHQKITLNGEVVYPGTYVLQNKSSKLSNLLERAGGLTEYANDVSSFLLRNGEEIALRFDKIQKSKRSKYNIELIDGDIITFNRKTNIVKITGEVSSPGTFQYVKGVSAKDYIKLAGGFTKNSARFSALIKYPNGYSSKIGLFGDEKVLDG